MLKRVARATVLVSDYDRAIDFYTNTLGFAVNLDMPYDAEGHRWIEANLPDDGFSVVLFKPHGAGMGEPGATRNVMLETTQDIFALQDQLRAKDVTITMEASHMPPAPPLLEFADPDGNKFMVSQRG